MNESGTTAPAVATSAGVAMTVARPPRLKSLRAKAGVRIRAVVWCASALVLVGCTAVVDTATPVAIAPSPVFEGQLPEKFPALGTAIAGDPDVIHDENGYRMYYACYGIAEQGTEVCVATSEDGIHWVDASIGAHDGSASSQILFGGGGTWDDGHETPFAVQSGANTLLYFAGYANARSGFFAGGPVSIGIAVSTDGVNFQTGREPVLRPTAGSLDDHGMTSPSVFDFTSSTGAMLTGMTYTGWCLDPAPACPRQSGGKTTALLGATSADGGHTWEKWADSLNLVPDDQLPPYAPNGIAETHVFPVPGETGPSTQWVMLFTAVGPDGPASIGLATQTGRDPFGPWNFREGPLIAMEDLAAWPLGPDATETRPVAPHGLIENGTLKMWFAGEANGFRIGYAEGSWPLRQ